MILVDYLVIALFLAGVFVLGMRFTRRASKSTAEFTLADRKMPWWLAGTSLLAGQLNAETALHQSRKAREMGLAGNWFYWSPMITAVVDTVLFSRLWRRTGVSSPVEFYDIRYHGLGSRLNRTWDAVYMSLIQGAIFPSFGLLGMKKIAAMLFGLPPMISLFGWYIPSDLIVVLGAVAIAMTYSLASGVHGVVWTDLAEFFVAVFTSYVLLYFVYSAIGGPDGLRAQVAALGEKGKHLLEWRPDLSAIFLVYLLVLPLLGCGSIQPSVMRYLSVKDEREALRTSLWRMINHYSVRTWPWVICGLAMYFLISDSELLSMMGAPAGSKPDWEMGYPALIVKYMPAGLIGLMIAGFLAAFMSSIGADVLTNASIFVNDLYRPILRKAATEAHYLAVIRLLMGLITILAIGVALAQDDILGLFGFVIMVTKGAGLIPVLRWFWWRVNSWADLTARTSVFGAVYYFDYGAGRELVTAAMSALDLSGWDARFAISFLFTTTSVTLISLVVMFCTPPDPQDKLREFYRRVRPYGWWGPVAAACPEVRNPDSFRDILRLILACTVYGFAGLVAFGALFFGHWIWSLVGFVLVGLTVKFILREADRLYRSTPVPPTSQLLERVTSTFPSTDTRP